MALQNYFVQSKKKSIVLLCALNVWGKEKKKEKKILQKYLLLVETHRELLNFIREGGSRCFYIAVSHATSRAKSLHVCLIFFSGCLCVTVTVPYPTKDHLFLYIALWLLFFSFVCSAVSTFFSFGLKNNTKKENTSRPYSSTLSLFFYQPSARTYARALTKHKGR